MKELDFIAKKIAEAEIRIRELLAAGDLKKLNEKESHEITEFYLQKSENRLKTATLIMLESQKKKDYNDFSEVVSADYYAMYYIVHSFIAKCYKIKLRDGLRGVHAITHHLVAYYLVKTNLLARQLYENYRYTLQANAEIQDFNPDEYREAAYEYVQKYQKQKEKREIFTYFSSKNAEEHHAKISLDIAQEFISVIKQLPSP